MWRHGQPQDHGMIQFTYCHKIKAQSRVKQAKTVNRLALKDEDLVADFDREIVKSRADRTDIPAVNSVNATYANLCAAV